MTRLSLYTRKLTGRLAKLAGTLSRLAEPEVGDLQFGVHALDYPIIFTPVELKSFSGGKLQGHIGVAGFCTLDFQLFLSPLAGKDGDPIVGAGIAQLCQIEMQLLDTAPLLSVSPGLPKQPTGEGHFIIVQLGGDLRLG